MGKIERSGEGIKNMGKKDKEYIKNNIFNYAKNKEFAQDIAIAWLINCYNYEETKNIGEKFIKEFIFDNNFDNGEKLEEVKAETQFKVNKGKIDVYAKIKIDKQTYSIIFENKEGTFLHDNQLSTYIEGIKNDEKSKNIIVILFKNKNIFPFEKLQYKKEQKNIKENNQDIEIEFKLKDTQDFLRALDDKDNDILNMLYKFYEKQNNDNADEKNLLYELDTKKWEKLEKNLKEKLGEKKIVYQEFHKVRGVYRTLFEIEDTNFLANANKILNGKITGWGYGIDWEKETKIKLFCRIGENRCYESFSEEKYEKNVEYKQAIDTRKELVKHIKKELKDIEKMNSGQCKKNVLSLIILKIEEKDIEEESIINGILSIHKKMNEIFIKYSNKE